MILQSVGMAPDLSAETSEEDPSGLAVSCPIGSHAAATTRAPWYVGLQPCAPATCTRGPGRQLVHRAASPDRMCCGAEPTSLATRGVPVRVGSSRRAHRRPRCERERR